MADPGEGEPRVFLQPGELFTSETPTRVKTVLGSCVAITMRAPRQGVASMSHCMLPVADESTGRLPQTEALRYVDATIEIMLAQFAARGIQRADLEVKLFGGAQRVDPEVYRIGSRNVEAARSALASYGLNVLASVTGGRQGTVVEFDTGTGDVWVKKLS